MAKCAYCNGTILFGGKKEREFNFCNDRCLQGGYLIAVAQQIPDDLVKRTAFDVHNGRCPKCQGNGPVDVHTSHKIWSVLVMTSWSSNPQICCRACGIKNQLYNTFVSGIVGWWGFPWGIIMTPIQIVRNIKGMIKGPDPLRPSDELEAQLRLALAAQTVEEQEASAT